MEKLKQYHIMAFCCCQTLVASRKHTDHASPQDYKYRKDQHIVLMVRILSYCKIYHNRTDNAYDWRLQLVHWEYLEEQYKTLLYYILYNSWKLLCSDHVTPPLFQNKGGTNLWTRISWNDHGKWFGYKYKEAARLTLFTTVLVAVYVPAGIQQDLYSTRL